jgi:1,4-alpha-glucan branching enzyme
MSLKKQYLKTKPVCKVTFRISKAAAKSAKRINVVGDFNNWSITQTPMRSLKSGEFTVTVDLETSRAYEFRYILDGIRWENDWEADRYVPSRFADCENSVVDLD